MRRPTSLQETSTANSGRDIAPLVYTRTRPAPRFKFFPKRPSAAKRLGMWKSGRGRIWKRREELLPAAGEEGDEVAGEQVGEAAGRWRRPGFFLPFTFMVIAAVVFLVQGLSPSLIRGGLTPPPFPNNEEQEAQPLEASLGCTMPELDPFAKQVMPFVKTVKHVKCGDYLPLTTLEQLPSAQDRYVLRIEKNLIPKYVPAGHNLSCCYSNIARYTMPPTKKYVLEADDFVNLSQCVSFKKEVHLRPEEEFILVRCFKEGNTSHLKSVYTNSHTAIRIKRHIRKKMRRRVSPKDENKLNVLILCYDSISQLNLLRTMPKTVKFLEKMGFYNFRGYTKVGENTFPNALAMFSGLNVSQAKTKCWNTSRLKDKRLKGVIDDCPFIWKEFHKRKYVTGYFDDALTIGARTYATTFVKQPTDYYLRPYILATQRYLPVKSMFGRNVCIGPISCTDQVLDYVMKFATTFQKYFFFSIAWLGNFSHNDINLPGALDTRTYHFFEELGLYNIYNNTIVLFVSDHGMRYGNIRSTMQGWYEERMPFLYMSVPDWLRKKHDIEKNLENNQNKLISTFDIFVTLRDILNIGMNDRRGKESASLACPKCQSLISEKIGERQCGDAGIPDEFCTCTQYTEMSTSMSMVRRGAENAVRQINNYIKNNRKCMKVSLKRIVKSQYNKQIQTKHSIVFLVTFETFPSGGLYQSIIKHNHTNGEFSFIGRIQRINSIGDQAECIRDEELKLYCLCKN